MPFNPYVVLGISQDADEQAIKKAFKKKALQCHPDKGGKLAEMSEINKAYGILINKDELQKWRLSEDGEESLVVAGLVSTSSERPSAAYQRLLQIFTDRFQQVPLQKRSAHKGKKELAGLTELSQNWVKEAFYNHLFQAHDENLEFSDVFAAIRYNTKSVRPATLLTDQFFKESLTQQKATDILLDFLRGNYYAMNLQRLKDYLEQQIKPLYQLNNPERTFYQAILAIISAENLENDYPMLLKAFNDIYSSVYQRRDANNPQVIRLMHDKYYRHLVLKSLTCYWQSDKEVVTVDTLRGMTTQLKPGNRFSAHNRTILRIEQQLGDALLDGAPLAKLYEAAFLQIDLSEAHVSMASVINSLMTAAMCFQYGAKCEQEPASAMADERISFILYQQALQLACSSTDATTGLYAATHIAKMLSEFTYDQSTLTPKQVEQLITREDDSAIASQSGSIDEYRVGAIKRAFYILNFCPLYSIPRSTIDFGTIQIFQTGLLRFSLDKLLETSPVVDHRLADVTYHAYDESIRMYVSEQEAYTHNLHTIQLKLKAMDELLKESNLSYLDMAQWVAPPFVHVYKENGWLTPINALDFPEVEGVVFYKKCDGLMIDLKTAKLSLLLETWHPGDDPAKRLFSDIDVEQMLTNQIDGAFFSLDPADPDKPYHPLQNVRYSPPQLKGTGYLQTLFWADYILKMFTTGREISSEPPYLTRSTEKMLERLPPHLIKILTGCSSNVVAKRQTHRFWITPATIDTEEIIEEGERIRVVFQDMAMQVQTKLMKPDDSGKLSDVKTAQKVESPEEQFAREMTECFDEIATYFPEFARLKQLIRLSAVCAKMRIERENEAKAAVPEIKVEIPPHRETHYQIDETILEGIYLKPLEEKIKTLSSVIAMSPPFVLEAHELDDVDWWSGQLKDMYTTKLDLLKSQHARLPKMFYKIDDPETDEKYQAYIKMQRATVFESCYQQEYERNKQTNISQYGQARWDLAEPEVVKQLTALINREINEMVERVFSKEAYFNDVLDEEVAVIRRMISNTYHEKYREIQQRIGKAEYVACLHAFMDGDCEKLAHATAVDEIEYRKNLYRDVKHNMDNHLGAYADKMGEVAYSEALEASMKGDTTLFADAMAKHAIDIDKVKIKPKKIPAAHEAKLEEKEDSEKSKEVTKSLKIPAVFHKGRLKRVCGGINAYPLFSQARHVSTQLNKLSVNKSDVRAVEQIISAMQKHTKTGFDPLVMQLEGEVRRVQRELFQLEIKGMEDLLRFNSQFFSYRSTLQQQVVEHVQTAVTDPFTPIRLKRMLNETFDRTRQSLAEIQQQDIMSSSAASSSFFGQSANGPGNSEMGGSSNGSNGGNGDDPKDPIPPVWTINARVHKAALPDTGRVRYVPPEGYDPKFSLPRARGSHNGYIDRHGNEWVKGPSRVLNDHFEWDVRLSRVGERFFRNMEEGVGRSFVKKKGDGSYVNISPMGQITH
ncbi:MAG: polymorphic toxin type 17 domain-containing protein [Legionellales bacterium]